MFASHLLGHVINGLRPVSISQQHIELQPGQVFRGVIVKAFHNQMVQVQLAGTTLYAQLSASLEVGQQAWLQVLPKSHPITLKVIDTPRHQSSSNPASLEQFEKSSMEGLLRGLGLKADRMNVQNLQLMIAAGIPLETEELGRILDVLRSSNSIERTLQVLQLAHQRGLPLTNEVIRSLDAAFFGKSLEELVNQLTLHIKDNRQAEPLLQRAAQIWHEARANISTLISATVQTSSPPPNTGAGIVGQQQANTTIPQLQVPVAPSMSTIGAKHHPEHTLHNLVNSQSQSIQYEENIQSASVNSKVVSGSTNEHNGQIVREPVLQTFFKLLGINYEQSLLTRGSSAVDSNSSIKAENLQQLKGILLELRGLDHLSSTLRETIDQGIRNVTGQQLLMVNDGNTPWNSFIFQIPLPNMQNTEPSYIHIEGRKKGKEAIDHENCRLFFHLDLDGLDQTMIDIQITNRIMSIHIYNDLPVLKEWIEEGREEWSAVMLGHEYHLSSIKVQPIPQTHEQQTSTSLPVQRSSYQGVDVRI